MCNTHSYSNTCTIQKNNRSIEFLDNVSYIHYIDSLKDVVLRDVRIIIIIILSAQNAPPDQRWQNIHNYLFLLSFFLPFDKISPNLSEN